ncbi:hypothetical protein [Gaetbulibacter aestuarii]|uniref:Glycerophosphoryl diester phosphodiesterase membrane domain-containing protein n=1 Tax=Gaetbulibacter aestuarii TaxID=1502358 RepID=A0ABW7N0W2_9FLAO
MNTLNQITEKIRAARALDFGIIFNEAIELFKKTWIQGFLLQLFTILVMLPLIIMVYVPFIGLIIAQEKSRSINEEAISNFFAGMSVLYIAVVIICALVLGAVSIALNAGFFRIMKKLDHNETVSTNDFFYFVKGRYLGKAFTILIVTFLLSAASLLLCYTPLIYLFVPMSYFAVFFAFNPDLSAGEIISQSFRLGNKKWLLSFGLIVVSYLLAQIIGLITCGIGSLFTMAFVYHPVYLIYKHVVGFNDPEPIDEIGTTPVE